jgi:nitrogen fixation protein FixH
MNKPIVAPRALTGRVVLISLVGFFAVVIGVNLLMAKLAIDTLPGTEVDSAYGASLAYESEIVAAHDQNLRNWKVDAHVERRADGAATVELQARDSNGAAMPGLRFLGRFERPTDRRADQPVTLAEVGGGIYRGDALALPPGQWDLVLEGDVAGRRMFLSKNRIVLN